MERITSLLCPFPAIPFDFIWNDIINLLTVFEKSIPLSFLTYLKKQQSFHILPPVCSPIRDIGRKAFPGKRVVSCNSFFHVCIYCHCDLATKREDTKSKRNKLIYTITESGCDYLKKWLSLPVEKDELRYETLLKLFFLKEQGEEQAIIHIEAFAKKIA